jgi:hypothetical protein
MFLETTSRVFCSSAVGLNSTTSVPAYSVGARSGIAMTVVVRTASVRQSTEPFEPRRPPNNAVRGLRQAQYDPKDQERKVHTLRGMDDDAHPGAAEAPTRKCVKEDTANYRRQDAPGLVEMVGTMEHTVRYPTPPAKYSLHLGKQHSSK